MKCEGCEHACGYCPEDEYDVEPAEKQTKLLVGKAHLREVSVLNNELFKKAIEVMEKSIKIRPGVRACIGWHSVGNFIDWLEQNYNIEKKL